MEVSVKKISDDVRLKQWMGIIRECRESGSTVSEWCRDNNISEPSYYYWLKKIRKMAVDSMPEPIPIVEVTPQIENGGNDVPAVCITVRSGRSVIEIPANCPEWMLERILDRLC